MSSLSDKQKKDLKRALGNDDLAEAISTEMDGLRAGTSIADGGIATDKIADLGVTSAKLGADAVSGADKIADNAVSLEHLDSGVKPILVLRAIEDALTTSREDNIAGLASAIALANSLKTVMGAHAADALDHTTAIDNVNFPIVAADATDTASLITLVTELLTAYDTHEGDAELGAAWVYHAAQEAGDHSLASAVAPTDLQECITRLNDLKAKYNAHDADATAHGVGSAHQEATANAAYGAAIRVAVLNVATGDLVQWSILDAGTGTVTGISAVANVDGFIDFTFSADPQNDAIISFFAARTAV